jgi:hypothetical protein
MLILEEKMLIFPLDISIFAEEISISREKLLIFPPDMSIFAEKISIPQEKMLILGEKMTISPPNMRSRTLDAGAS